jgi:hypothetical protein
VLEEVSQFGNALDARCGKTCITLIVVVSYAEDEHDVVWFWLKKDEPHECPVCSQYFTVI